MPTRYAGSTDMTIRSQEWLPTDRRDERGRTHSSGPGVVRPRLEHRYSR